MNFYKKRFKLLNQLSNKLNTRDIEYLESMIIDTNEIGGKVILCGNGGSSATASHVSVDFTISTNIKAINFNEYNLITCFSNDFRYENWIKKSLEIYGSPKDLLILISCSGNSKNLINANNYAKNIGMKVATLTGCKKTNKLNSNKYNHSIWINSKDYNVVESIHHTILLTIVDSIKKKIKK
jgi:D-sedoheptulose 7-phosphate isomerase